MHDACDLSCIVDQHYICCALSGDKPLQAMTMPIDDVPYPSPYDYHLPESLATAFGLCHDLHYLKEFDPHDAFLTEQVLRHNFYLRVDPYSNGDFNHVDDCHFLGTFEVHTLFENDDDRACSDQALDSVDGDGSLKGSKDRTTDFSVKAKYPKVKLGVSHLPLRQH